MTIFLLWSDLDRDSLIYVAVGFSPSMAANISTCSFFPGQNSQSKGEERNNDCSSYLQIQVSEETLAI